MLTYDIADLTELHEVEELEKYRVDSRREIARVLAGLARRPEVVTGYFNDGTERILTAVVKLLPERNLLVLDYGPDEASNRRLLQTGRMTCLAKQNDVSIRFNCEPVQRARLSGEPVFVTPIPETLFRLQRREFFRVATPIANPLTCRVQTQEGTVLNLRVLNISAGGVGLQVRQSDGQWERGHILPTCSIELPEFGLLRFSLEVRNVIAEVMTDADALQYVGCAFVNLSADRTALLQRYINKLQIEEKAIGRM